MQEYEIAAGAIRKGSQFDCQREMVTPDVSMSGLISVVGNDRYGTRENRDASLDDVPSSTSFAA